MPRDFQALQNWTQVFLIVAAICTTTFPLLYSRSGWRQYLLGRLLMLQAVAFAFAIDVTLLFTMWVPGSILLIFVVNAVVFGLIAIASVLLTWKMWALNHPTNKEEKEKIDERLHARTPRRDRRKRTPRG